MEILVQKILVRNGEICYTPEQLKENKNFLYSNEGEVLIQTLEIEGEMRTSEANAYYWAGILQTFVLRGHFQTVYDAHDHFTKKFLSQETVLDLKEESFNDLLQKIVMQAQKSKNSIKVERLDDKVIIYWIKSTTALTKKQFAEYCANVMLDGNEQGIDFEPPKKKMIG